MSGRAAALADVTLAPVDEYHRSRRAGLTGAEGWATWAIPESGSPVHGILAESS